MRTQYLSQLKAVVYGAAVGDALGVPFEFLHRDTFECKGMCAGGYHNMPLGTFSDDTSLLIATCDSIRATKGIDIDDMRAKFRQWCFEGRYSADGKVFDVGNATVTALDQGFGCSHERSNGNGSLMRIAPLAFMDASDDQIRSVSAITHAHTISTESCVVFVHILRHVLGGMPLQSAIAQSMPEDPRFAFLGAIQQLERDGVNSGGFVLHTLEAALWCALTTDSYRDCVLAAVNLGSDTDTTACVAGALAGAIYGYSAIPAEWIDQLRGRQVIDSCLFDAE
ncbi:MAG: ADP-ribosylglycohydrolase family protein [Coriobacteriaceae bacterium]|nr:ADP-ribosylglycohydrolase family protein [Coriobacteriaceae bacterium]